MAKDLKNTLTPEEFYVTQECGTEPPFKNRYWDNKEDGIYVDVVSGVPLFSSLDKYDSGSGWPSFTQPLAAQVIYEKEDLSFGRKRTEVRSKKADSHLGHVFNDGPQEAGGLRYCINSAALRFVSIHELKDQGYEKELAAFLKAGKTVPELAYLAGGCFWGMEELLRKLPGVLRTQVGYTGGAISQPTYREVSKGNTGHAEAVRVAFDPNVISYERILEEFFCIHDPTTMDRQGNDVGSQYRSAIFVKDETQESIVKKVVARINAAKVFSSPIVTAIEKFKTWTPAEKDHQDYLQRNPEGYTCHFRRNLKF